MIGEIKIWAGATLPAGYLFCDGKSYGLTRYPELYKAIGVTYGGDDLTFKVPDLRGRVPIGAGQGTGLTNRVLGASAGAEAITDVPEHNHRVACNNASGAEGDPQDGFPGLMETAGDGWSLTATPAVFMNVNMIENTGEASGVDVTPPCQAINYIIKAK